MKFKIAFYSFLLCLTFCLNAQKDKGSRNWTGPDLGLGAGLDYGGLGGRFTIMIHKSFGIFGSGGYALAGFGYNCGANVVFRSERKTIPYLTGMYGYNCAIKVHGAIEFQKVYYGPSFGMGLKRIVGRNNHFINFELLVPVRDPAFRMKVDELKRMGAKFNIVPPFAISVGFHFGPPKVSD